MHPVLIWCTQLGQTKDNSWTLRPLVVSLTVLFGVVLAIIWQYGINIVSVPSQASVRDWALAVSLDYLPLFAVGATAFIMVTILHVFFKLPFLPTCGESPGSKSSLKTVSEKNTDSPVLDIHSGKGDNEEILYYDGDFVDIARDPCTHFFDVETTTEDPPDPYTATDDDTAMPEGESDEMVKSWASPETSRREDRHVVLNSQSRLSTAGPGTSCTTDLDVPCMGEPDENSSNCMRDVSTQTDALPRPATVSVGTMTSNPRLVDVSVGCQNLYKLVKSSNTTTSGPFMKKLRRAQRLLKEARVKLNTERHSKLVTWTEVLARYKDRLQYLTQSLDKKDVLLSYTALNKALSENEVKDMCTAVSSARDRLLTQCKLNSALKEVVVSKCDSATSATSSQTSATQN